MNPVQIALRALKKRKVAGDGGGGSDSIAVVSVAASAVLPNGKVGLLSEEAGMGNYPFARSEDGRLASLGNLVGEGDPNGNTMGHYLGQLYVEYDGDRTSVINLWFYTNSTPGQTGPWLPLAV